MIPDNSRVVVVLGSEDPEMVEIAHLAGLAGARVIPARSGGRRVRPGELADKASVDEIYALMQLQPVCNRMILVELPGKAKDVVSNTGAWVLETYAISDNWPVTVQEVDHHDPAQVWSDDVALYERSSIGQIANLIGVELDERQQWIGALDHDLPGALRLARTPGPHLGLDEVLMIYASGASQLFGGVAPEVYVAQAKSTADQVEELAHRPDGLDEAGWVNVWRIPPNPSTAGVTGEWYPLPALPLALALSGRSGLSVIRRRDGVFAWRLQCASADQVRYFLAEGEHPYRMVRDLPAPNAPYGFPDRGLGGATLTPDEVQRMPWATNTDFERQLDTLYPRDAG